MNTEYESDFYAWARENAALLRSGQLSRVDLDHIAEELEDMGKSERRALGSHLRVLLTHLLKWRYQPSHRGVSWRLSIRNARLDIAAITKDSPSLKPQISALLADEYPGARSLALDETGLPPTAMPTGCPFDVAQVLDADYWPE